MIATPTDQATDRKLRRDLRTLVQFVEIYSRDHHPQAVSVPMTTKLVNLQDLTGRSVDLCPDCAKLLAHAVVKRCVCLRDPKPACKHCPSHCYHPTYRSQIRRVM